MVIWKLFRKCWIFIILGGIYVYFFHFFRLFMYLGENSKWVRNKRCWKHITSRGIKMLKSQVRLNIAWQLETFNNVGCWNQDNVIDVVNLIQFIGILSESFFFKYHVYTCGFDYIYLKMHLVAIQYRIHEKGLANLR